jgi:UDP-N-acetyl-D-mannosaminuronic acid dehydrogenase
MNIGIIGLGYVGLTLAIGAASKGLNVYGIEIDSTIMESLSQNQAHFYEPGINNLISRYQGKRFFASKSFPEDVEYDAFIVTVGTPLKSGSKEPNFDYILSALDSIKKVYNGKQLIILRSTVSVGTTRKVVLPYLSSMSGLPQEDVLVSMCPERTIEGNAIEELTHLPQIVSGNNAVSIKIARDIFFSMTPSIVEVSSLEEAELIKLYCNTYRDMHFAIGNAFCMAAQEFGVDGVSAIKHANYGYARSNIALPGFVAGPCLQKDAYILINNMPSCDSRDFILSARKFNESLEELVVQWVKENVGLPNQGVRIAVSGMAFKGRPETSDLRGSSSVYIARKLKAAGYSLNLHDFCAKQEEMNALNLGDCYEGLYDACTNASALLVLNNHKKYATVVDKPSIQYSENRPFRILDSWGACTELYYSDLVKINTLGNMFV